MATAPRGDRKDMDQIAAAAANVESDIREFVRRDQFAPRRLRQDNPQPEARGEVRDDRKPALPHAPQLHPASENVASKEINDLIRRVSGGSMEEIDRVILELQSVREMLRTEGERVTREIAGYASLNNAAMTAMKIIAESMTQWKAQPPRDENR